MCLGLKFLPPYACRVEYFTYICGMKTLIQTLTNSSTMSDLIQFHIEMAHDCYTIANNEATTNEDRLSLLWDAMDNVFEAIVYLKQSNEDTSNLESFWLQCEAEALILS